MGEEHYINLSESDACPDEIKLVDVNIIQVNVPPQDKEGAEIEELNYP